MSTDNDYTQWVTVGSGVSIRSFDENGREVFDVATITQVGPDSIVLDTGEHLHGVIDLRTGVLSMSPSVGGSNRWSAEVREVQGRISPSDHFSKKWGG